MIERIDFGCRSFRATLLVSAFALASSAATAHTNLIAPDGGETLAAGTSFTICWTIAIQHDTQDWDLWYSTEGNAGPWIVIAEDLPAGDPTPGSEHAYDWTVPNVPDDTVWVRVRQDNSGFDYYDISDEPFTITASCVGDVDANGAVGFADLSSLLSAWGTCVGCPGDLDGDGTVGFVDLNSLLAAWGSCP